MWPRELHPLLCGDLNGQEIQKRGDSCIPWLPWWLGGKVSTPAMQALLEMHIGSLGWKDPLEEAWQPTPVFLPGASRGQRSLEGHSPQGHKELDATEAT